MTRLRPYDPEHGSPLANEEFSMSMGRLTKHLRPDQPIDRRSMSHSKPTVSVVVPYSPVHTPAPMLEAAKRSVARQSVPTEIIVVEDREQRGPAVARNVGLERADTRYVAFLDADDRWHGDKLERQLARMEATDAGLCVDGTAETRDDFVYDLLLGDLNEIMSSVIIDTEQVDARFEERLGRWEDHLFVLESSTAGVCFTEGTFTVNYHDSSLSAGGLEPLYYLEQGKRYLAFAFDRVPETRPYVLVFYRQLYFVAGVYFHQDGEYRRAITYFSRSLQIGLSPYPIAGIAGSTAFLVASEAISLLEAPRRVRRG